MGFAGSLTHFLVAVHSPGGTSALFMDLSPDGGDAAPVEMLGLYRSNPRALKGVLERCEITGNVFWKSSSPGCGSTLLLSGVQLLSNYSNSSI